MAVVQAAGEMTAPPPCSDSKASLVILVAADGQQPKPAQASGSTQRGHRVDLVDDGGRALKELLGRQWRYRPVGFNLPTMDGLRVVAEFNSSPAAAGGFAPFHRHHRRRRGVHGTSRQLANFHPLVIAKPIDLTNLGTVVENFERYMAWRSQAAVDQKHGRVDARDTGG